MVDRFADNAPREFSHKVFAAGQKAQIRTAESKRKPQRLPFTRCDVRAAFRGGFKKRKRDGITTHHEFRALFLCDFSDAFRVFDKPEKVGLLDTYRADFVVDKRFKSVRIGNAVFVGAKTTSIPCGTR